MVFAVFFVVVDLSFCFPSRHGAHHWNRNDLSNLSLFILPVSTLLCLFRPAVVS